MTSGVYLITNLSNGKLYVGSAKSIEARVQGHFKELEKNCHGNRHLQNAYNSYGDVFEVTIIYECENANLLTIEELKEDILNVEQQYLDYYWDSGILYNLTPTAGSTLGFKMSEDSIERLRASHKGKVMPDEVRNKISEANKGKFVGDNHPMYGRRHTDEAKEKIGLASLGNTYSLGHKHTEDLKDQRSEKYTGVGNPFHGKEHTDESKLKMSIAQKKRFERERTNKQVR